MRGGVFKMDRSAGALSRRGLLVSGAAAAAFALSPSGLAGAATEDLSFVAIGDWGFDGSPSQRRVAAAMGQTAAAIGSRFVISLGDNFYEDGVGRFDDPRWRTAFDDVYAAPALATPWNVVLGNHDRRGNAMAQVAHSDVDGRWHMPAPYFKRRETLADGSAADFFYLDTTWIWSELGAEPPGDDADDQLAWLDQALAASQAPWKIVVGHHPVFSGGYHGNTPGLVRAVKPMLERHGVAAYLNGHDHDLQHIVVDGIHYVTCGTGADARPTSVVDGSLFAASRLGFMAGVLTPKELSFAFMSDGGETIYRSAIPRRA